MTNQLLGRDAQATQEGRGYDGRGRHTTTSRQLLIRSQGGAIIDTPGLRGLETWDATEAAKANAATSAVANAVTKSAQVVDPNEVNDLDRAAAASVSAESSWLTYLLLILATALAAASAFWFFFRSAHPRMRMSNS